MAILSLLLVAAAGCSETTTQPAAPSLLPTEKVESLALACPAGPQVESMDGAPVEATFDPPTVIGGLAPVAVTCTPESGSRFRIGRHTVTCAGTDQLGLTASCTLRVTVFRRVDISRILAFGDSLTSGTGVSRAASYPAVLEGLLQGRYGSQRIQVTNEGLPGNPAAIALPRFEAALRRHDPDVVLIMQGTIDLDIERGAEAVEALRNMVDHARARGSDPIIATIPPQGRSRRTWEQVDPYNRQIRQIAAANRVPLVDVNRIIRAGRCSDGPARRPAGSFSCLAADDLHLTAQGYALVAQGFFDELRAQYETAAPGGQLLLSRGDR